LLKTRPSGARLGILTPRPVRNSFVSTLSATIGPLLAALKTPAARPSASITSGVSMR
jgi:hypothetical protein